MEKDWGRNLKELVGSEELVIELATLERTIVLDHLQYSA